MRVLHYGFVALAMFTFTACPGEEAPQPAFEEPTATPTPPPADPVVTPGAQQANLQAVGESGVTGEVHATPRDNQTEIRLVVNGAPPNESVGARIMSGTCENPGVELARLDAVSTDATGMGQSVTTVGHAPHLIMDGNHVAAVYGPGTEPERDQPIACATLPAHQ